MEQVQKAIQNGADANAKDKDGKMALMFAKKNKNPKVAETLIAAGAK